MKWSPIEIACLACLLLSAPVVAVAQEKQADLRAYCVQTYGAEAEPNIDNRDQGLLCTLRTNQGLGLLHHKIEAADVCASQHGTRRFRKAYGKVFCVAGTAKTGPDKARQVDLEKYCREVHGAGATLATRRTDNAPMCRVVTSGGLGHTFHVIQLSDLCGRPAAPSQVKGKILDCAAERAKTAEIETGERKSPASNEQKTEPGTGRPGPDGQPGGDRQTGSPAAPNGTAAAATRPVDGDISGCYHYYSVDFAGTQDAEGEDPMWGGVEFDCPGLSGGGWTTTAQEFCVDFPKADYGMADGDNEVRYAGDKPYCWSNLGEHRTGFHIQGACLRKYQHIMGIDWQNSTRQFEEIQEWDCSIAARWQDGVLSCYFIGEETRNSLEDRALRLCGVPEEPAALEVRFTDREFNTIDEAVIYTWGNDGDGTGEVWVEVEASPDDSDYDDAVIDRIQIRVHSESDTVGAVVTCIETASASRIFRSQHAVYLKPSGPGPLEP